MHVIESIGSWGVSTTPLFNRINVVKAGDIIECPEEFRKYPCSHRYSRISNIDADGIAHVCEGMGSAFLLPDGSCDISGGPWWSMPIDLLTPTGSMHRADYWNWGDNHPGAAQGVHYQIERPVHRMTKHPNSVKQRHAENEAEARIGNYSHEHPLGEEWELHKQSKEPVFDGEYLFVFVLK